MFAFLSATEWVTVHIDEHMTNWYKGKYFLSEDGKKNHSHGDNPFDVIYSLIHVFEPIYKY